MESGDLEPRVEALENQVRDLTAKVQVTQQDAAAARVLAEEVAQAQARAASEIRGELRDFRNATTASFNALRQDFVDLREHVDRKFEQVDQGFMEMRGRFDAAAAGQQRIVDLLTTIMRER